MSDKGYGNLMLLEKDGNGIGRITFNRPEKRNAMSTAAQAELRAALADSYDCHVLVITGKGPAFCAGVDLSEARERREAGIAPPRQYASGKDSWGDTCQTIADHPACCIAAVNGYAIAGGISVVNSCDLAIASDKAEFGMTEMGFNTFPGLVAPLTAKMVNRKRLAWMIFTVQRIDAQTAEKWGLVNKVVPHDQLYEEVDALAKRVAQLDPVLIDYAKKATHVLQRLDWETAAHYGGLVTPAARSQGAGGRDSVERFLSGQPGLGQGTQPR